MYPKPSVAVSIPKPGIAPVPAATTWAPNIPEPATFGSTAELAIFVITDLGAPATLDVISPALPVALAAS